VSASNGELQKAEEKLNALTDELQQARTALADEWEDHMTAAERLAEADRKNEELRKMTAAPEPLRSPRPSGALVGTEHHLPVTIHPLSQALARADIPQVHAVHDPAAEPGNPAVSRPAEVTGVSPMDRARSVADLRIEDLFEDEPGEVYSGPVPAQPVEEDPETPEPDAAGSAPAEPLGTGPVIPEEITTPDESVIPDEEEEGEEEKSSESQIVDASTTGDSLPQYAIPSGLSFNRKQWFDLFAWARHENSLSSDQRMQIIRMGRLIQRGRKLTVKQEEQVREIITLAQAHGYQFS
jgi:hypothetical protein